MCHSYATTIGYYLKSPLITLCSLSTPYIRENPGLFLVKIITNLALRILFTIPCSVLYISGSLISRFSSVQVNKANLHLVANALPLPKESLYPYQRLLNLAATPEFAPKFGNTFRSFIVDDERIRQFLVYLGGILDVLEEDPTKRYKTDYILSQLQEAMSACPPTWAEKARFLYEELLDANTAEQKLLREVECYKEDIILWLFQHILDVRQWHVLNSVREDLGRELGLRATLAKTDIYQNMFHYTHYASKWFTRWYFWYRYSNANDLIEAITERINFKDYDQQYYEFFRTQLVEKHITTRENEVVTDEATTDYIAEHFYNNNGMTKEGVTFMLREIGVIC